MRDATGINWDSRTAMLIVRYIRRESYAMRRLSKLAHMPHEIDRLLFAGQTLGAMASRIKQLVKHSTGGAR